MNLLAINFQTISSVALEVVVFILLLGIIVLIHEGGHFFFAKRAGILCYEFAIGMGPVLFSKKIGETVYSIRMIPIGGFVSMAGEEVDQDPLKGIETCKLILKDGKVVRIIPQGKEKNQSYPELATYYIGDHDLVGTAEGKDDELFIEIELLSHHEYADKKRVENLELGEKLRLTVAKDAMIEFSNKEKYQIAPYDRLFSNKGLKERFLSVVAGPFMNIVLALVVFFILGLVQGYPVTSGTKVYGLTEGYSPLYEAGLVDGDEILYISAYDEEVDPSLYYTKQSQITDALHKMSTENVIRPQFYDEVIYVTYKNQAGDIKRTKVNPYIVINTLELILINSPEKNQYMISAPTKGSLFEKSGFQQGDILYSIEIADQNTVKYFSKDTFHTAPITDILEFFYSDSTADKQEYTVTVRRPSEGDKTYTYTVTSRYDRSAFESQGINAAQIYIGKSLTYEFSFVKLLYMPFVETYKSCATVFETLGLLIFNKSVGIKDLSGFVGIASATVTMVNNGFTTVLSWMGLLSANIAVMNLLPLPALDGGRLAFIAYEAITRRKASPKVENMIHSIGFILLMALFVVVTYNDIVRVITSIIK